MRYSTDPRIDEIVRRLVLAGWPIEPGSRHYRLATPDKRTRLTVPGSPSDGRAFLNWLAQSKRCLRQDDQRFGREPCVEQFILATRCKSPGERHAHRT